MCGICGILNFDNQPVQKAMLEKMCRELAHRGPDEEGYFIDKNIGLGHRRLSIIDLKTGEQPIHNEDKTFWLVVNGEIYNFVELRQTLEKKGHFFYTRTDSEVIVHLFEEYREDCLNFLRGMFAFALWDKKEEKLFLARDRFGKKPLYYYHDDGRIIFASEINALLQAPGIKREVDEQALNLYLSFQCVPAPWTMFKRVKKLLPAHYFALKDGRAYIRRYWNLECVFSENLKIKDYEQGIIERLDEAVKLRLVSDVPVGAFLSGGIDSSAVVALMAKNLREPVKTFSVGFREKLYNELSFAALIAKKFKTEHHELVVQPNAIEILPKLIKHYGEPFADYSCIPSYYIAQFAASKVKVVLNGDGGDEAFAGYSRYSALKAAGLLNGLPGFLRKLIGGLDFLIPGGPDMRTLRWQIKRFLRGLPFEEKRRYLNWICMFNQWEKQALYKEDSFRAIKLDDDYGFLDEIYARKKGADFTDKVTRAEWDTYLPNDLLVKMDIACMANSLEARSPFLDHKFMEYAAAIPLELKLKGLTNKYVLKRALRKILPAEIINRKKLGFGIPIGEWLRRELKDYAREILLDKTSQSSRYFKQDYIAGIIRQHNDGITDNGYKIWTLLVFELWHKEFIS